MFEEFFAQNENKTLEFKENANSLNGIIKTVIAFANTAGGILIIGVKDQTKEIIGLADVLRDEEKLANAISDNVSPLLVPDIEIHTYRERELIIIRIPHAAGPFYLKAEGPENGVYIRFGSTNRKADQEMVSALRLFASNKTHDELPVPNGRIDWNLVCTAFNRVNKQLTEKKCEMLGICSSHAGKPCPTVGGMLLFGANRLDVLPDSVVRCARFAGTKKEKIIDQQLIEVTLPFAIDEAIRFIERNTRLEGRFGRTVREDIPEYPTFAIREGVINALLHADYSMKGSHVQIAIFDNRIEITNPGGLPFGQTLQKALAGFSRLRNRVIGRVLRELNLIEQWGSGLQRILAVCHRQGLQKPEIEEINNHFRLTIFSTQIRKIILRPWEQILKKAMEKEKEITTRGAAEIWNVSDRTARSRLKVMMQDGVIQRIGTSEKDPRAVFILKQAKEP